MAALAALAVMIVTGGLCLLPAPAQAVDVIGTAPRNVPGIAGPIPNDAAIVKKIWAPGIDLGYDPQGVAFAQGAVLVSGYRSTNPGVDNGPCGIFRVNATTGLQEGFFAMPSGAAGDCTHAGGLAYAGAFTSPANPRQNILIVADTHHLYKIDMDRAFQEGTAARAILGVLKLQGSLKDSFNGSFIDMVGRSMFIGTYAERKSANPNLARGYFLDYSLFDTHNNQVVSETCCGIRGIALPYDAQGAAYDPARQTLWVTASSGKFGCLYQMETQSGRIRASYQMVAGIEDIAVDGTGKLWGVSEAGSMRMQGWATRFPVLFLIDVQKLQAAPAQGCSATN